MKKAIIVGASSGIGRQLALVLLTKGYRVGVTARRASLLATLKSQHPEAIVAKAFDCTQTDTLVILEQLALELRGMDLFVFCAGTGDLNATLSSAIENRTNQLNVMAFTTIVGWAFRYFETRQQGHLVAISSIAGFRGNRMAPAYNASKAYQINYLEGLRQKTASAKLNITVSDIRPGFVATAMAKGDGQFWVATIEKAALQIFNHIRRKSEAAYITKRWRIIAILLKFLPNWLYKRL
ncbi:MAG: SDR family NAD(P)-dependent oxidoreductase [Bacteroidota bacterium]